MKGRSLSSVFQFDSKLEQSPSKPKVTIKKLNLKAEKPFPSSGQESPAKVSSYKTIYSARHTPTHSIIEVKEALRSELKLDNFQFGNSKRASSVPKKGLPRLYTENLQKNMADKVEQVKEKYGVLYKYMLKAHGINVDREELKQIMKKSKPIFDSTYSIKYFGMTNSEFGIVSQRVPLQHIYQEANTTRTQTQTGPFSHRERTSAKHKAVSKEPGSISLAASTWNNLDNYNYGSLNKEPTSPLDLLHGLTERKDFIVESKDSISQQQENMSPTPKKTSNRVVVYSEGQQISQPEEVKFQLIPANLKNPIKTVTDLDERKSSSNLDSNILLSERTKRQHTETQFRRMGQSRDTTPERQPEIRTITTYAMPKKLEALRKRRQDDFGRKTVAINNERMSLEGPRDIPLMKTKNNGMIGELYPKEYIDELSIPEKFRTHEIKTLMSSQANYSYSKLLMTLYSKEKPEDVLIENTKKIEEIRLKREEMKRAHLQRQVEKKGRGSASPQNRIHYDDGDVKLHSMQGAFQIRITEPAMNPMYSNFTKIRERVDNEEDF